MANNSGVAFSLLFSIEAIFFLPQVLVYCLYDAFIVSILYTPKMGFLILETDRSKKEPYQENMGDEEGIQIHIQSQHSWQLVMRGQGRCPASRTPEPVLLTPFLHFSGVASAIRLHNMRPCSR